MSQANPGAERRIDNIEFNVADIARSKRFYGEVFGWHFTDYGATYTEFDDGRLKGGFVSDAPVRAQGGPLVILYCTDLADAQHRVIAAGGEVVQAVFAFPGGRRFHFRDLDGYELAVWCDVE
ncbi:VOC family protein [Stenotrophomonas maltophilia]|uniref:VOC family protein n=1 Tax=Stenotrophomonas maltophilia TaxID=40324 RepID=UPI00387604DC